MDNEDLIREKIAAIINSDEHDVILTIYDGGEIESQHELSQVCVRYANLIEDLRKAIS